MIRITLEGILLIVKDERPWRGAALLALGISIKIIPLIALGYLFLKKGILKSIDYTLLLTTLAFALPILILGFCYNTELLGNWKDKISPAGERYVFEDNVCYRLFFVAFKSEAGGGIINMLILQLKASIKFVSIPV